MQKKQSVNSKSNTGGVLTKYEIEKYKLIKRLTEAETYEPIDSDKIQATTYDLCVGEAHIIYNKNEPEKIYIGDNTERFKLFKDDHFDRQDEIKMEELTIAPYSSALIQLDEIVDTYSFYNGNKINFLIVGRFDLKLGKVSQGLISQQATQVEPFYKGRLFCYIHNLSSQPHILKFKETFATIEFFYVSGYINDTQQKEMIEILEKHNNEKYKNRQHCIIENDTYLGIKDIRYFLHSSEDISKNFGISHLVKDGINKELDQIVGKIVKDRKYLKPIVDEIEHTIDLKLKIIYIILPILLPIIFSIVTPLIINLFSKTDDSSQNNTNKTQNLHLDQSKLNDIYEGTE